MNKPKAQVLGRIADALSEAFRVSVSVGPDRVHVYRAGGGFALRFSANPAGEVVTNSDRDRGFGEAMLAHLAARGLT